MGLFGNRERMWIGTVDPTTGAPRMNWIPTPDTGADVSHSGFSAEAVLLNGGGYTRNSWDSHKVYQFSWGQSGSLQLASVVQGYANGSFGRGLLYFNDPMYYGTNILPSRWADPSMALNHEAPGIAGTTVTPTGSPAGASTLMVPVSSAEYALPISHNILGDEALTLVVPPGHQFSFGWIGETSHADTGVSIFQTGMSGISNGYVTPLPLSGDNVTSISGLADDVTGGIVRIAVRGSVSSDTYIIVNAMTARIFEPGAPVSHVGPWMSGEGHSGCRFVGKPTIVNYNGVDGGQVGISCTLKETGSWE